MVEKTATKNIKDGNMAKKKLNEIAFVRVTISSFFLSLLIKIKISKIDMPSNPTNDLDFVHRINLRTRAFLINFLDKLLLFFFKVRLKLLNK